MKTHNDKFYAYLEDLNTTYVELSGLLTQKAQVIQEDDLYTLDEIMSREQVYLLKVRGFDKNLENFRKQTGYKGEKLSDIILEMPEDDRPRFTLLHEALSSALDTAKIINDKCQRLAQVKLHGLNRPKADTGNNPSPEEKKKPRIDKPFSKSI